MKWSYLVDSVDSDIQRLLKQANSAHLDDDGMHKLFRLTQRAGKWLLFSPKNKPVARVNRIIDVRGRGEPLPPWVSINNKVHTKENSAPKGRIFFNWSFAWYTLDELYYLLTTGYSFDVRDYR